MAIQRKQTLDILIDGKRKRLRGVTKYTTCGDVIKMVTNKTVEPQTETPMFAVFESFNGKDRQLSTKDRIIKVLRSWGSDSEKIVISIRRVDDVKSKMAVLNDKRKRLIGLRTKAFTDISRQRTTFSSNSSSLELTNISNKTKQYLSISTQTTCHVQDKKRTGTKRKCEAGDKESVFRRIFNNVLKRRKVSKDETKRKVNVQKSVLSSDNSTTTSNKEFTYMDLQQSFKSHLDVIDRSRTVKLDKLPEFVKLDKLPELDTAFVDETGYLDVESSVVSMLNTGIMEDPEIESNDMDEIIFEEHTFVKLDRIKKLFDSNNSQYGTEDDFMESFMRSKLYESESDTDS